MSFFVALSKEWLEQWRTYRALAAAVVLVAFGLLSPVLARYMRDLFQAFPQTAPYAGMIPAPAVADAVDQYFKNLSQFGLLLALLLSMGAVAQEKERGTVAMLLSKPLPRGSFILAKTAAIGLTFALSLALAGLGGYVYTLALFQPLDPLSWLAANALLWLYFMVWSTVTLMFSALGRSQILAFGLSFGALALLGAVGAIPGVGQHLPGGLLGWAVSLALGRTATAWSALAASLGLLVAAWLVAWLSFRRQEL